MGHARERRLRPSVGQVGGDVGGRDGVTIPVLGLGVFQSPAEETAAAVETALRTGYRHIDTAAAYFNEREVGEGLRRSGVDRAEVFIETKIQVTDYGYDETLHAFEKSTGKLDTDVPTDDVAGTVKELIAERKSGSRRTPGLRREELATLAGISIDYYTRLDGSWVRLPKCDCSGPGSGDEQRHVVLTTGRAQNLQDAVARAFQIVATCRGEGVEEGVQASVDGFASGFDQAVGVEDQFVAGAEGDRGGLEGHPADAQRRAGGKVEKLRCVAEPHQDRGQVAGEADLARALVRVVDAVDAGGDGLLDTFGQVIQVMKGLGGGEGELGEGADSTAELTHGGGGFDAAAHDVPDDQGGSVTLERYGVVPVAADLARGAGGLVAAGDLQAGQVRWALRKQTALEGEGRLALRLVSAGVVDTDRGSGGQLPGEERVVVIEGCGVPGALEVESAEDFAPCQERYGQVGVNAGRREKEAASPCRAMRSRS